MGNEKVFAMSFAKVYPMLITKAERKGRTRNDVLEVTSWLTGYTPEQIEELIQSDVSYGDFFNLIVYTGIISSVLKFLQEMLKKEID